MIPKEIAKELANYFVENNICPICYCNENSNTGHVDTPTCDNCGYSWVV